MNDTSSNDAEGHYKRLAWQCRRGIKEVEVVLAPFFEQFFSTLDMADQERFEVFLKEADVDMFEWFMRRSTPDTPENQYMVDLILARMAPRS